MIRKFHNLNFKNRVLTLSVATILCSSLAFGYDISDAVKSAEPPKAPVNTKAPEPLPIYQSDNEPMTIEDGKKIFVKDFDLQDTGSVNVSEFENILSEYRNKELNMRDINEITSKITQFYREKGYIVAHAFVPKQEMKDEVLIIKIVVGKYGNTSFENKSLINDAMINRILNNALKNNDEVTTSSLERAMLLVSDMPGASLPKVTIGQGSEYGYSDFLLDIDKSQRVNGYIIGDNYGSRLTGKNRLMAGVDINSPLGFSDKLSFFGMISDKTDIKNGRVAYGFPLWSNGLRGELSAATTSYELGKEYEGLDAVGSATIFQGDIVYPIIRSQFQNLNLHFSYAHKDMEDKMKAIGSKIPKTINVATLGLSHEKYTSLFGLSTYFSIAGNVNLGHLSIDDDAEKALNKAGANTIGTYSKADISLLASLAFTEKLSFTSRATLQKALGNKNLDSSEQLTISGLASVRAYPDSEYSADNGITFGAELNYRLPDIIGINHNIGTFFDIGRGDYEDGDYAALKDRTLMDAGISYSVRYKSLFAKAQYARIIGGEKVESQKDYNNRYLLQIGATF